jgi:hypothetical protein
MSFGHSGVCVMKQSGCEMRKGYAKPTRVSSVGLRVSRPLPNESDDWLGLLWSNNFGSSNPQFTICLVAPP